MADADYWDIDAFLNLDGVDEEDTTAVGTSAGPQQAPATLVQPLHPVHVEPDVHEAAASSVQVQHPPAAPILGQQMLGESQHCDLLLEQVLAEEPSSYGFHDEMPMPAPIANVQQDFQFQAGPSDFVQHQKIQGDASAYGFHDQMPMPASIANVQHAFAAPSDYVQHPQDLVTAVQHQQIQGNASAYDYVPMPMPMQANIAHGQQEFQAVPSDYVQHPQDLLMAAVQPQQIILEAPAYGFHDHMPTPPSGGSEEDVLSLRPDESSEMMREYLLMQNVDYDIDVDFVHNHAGGSGATGLMDDEEDFVTLWPGRLQCDHCRVVRKIRFQSETREVFIFLHGADDGRFEHAIMEINGHGDDIQAPKMYIDFSRRPREFVLDFMENRVQSLRNEPGGAVDDSDDAAQNSDIIGALPPPPPPDEPPREADVDANILVKGLPAPRVFRSYDDEVQRNQPSESAEVQSGMPAMQQERAARSILEVEIRQYLQELKEKAQRELYTESAEVRSFCRRNNCTWKVVRIRKLNKLIVSLSQNPRMFGVSRLMAIRKRVDRCVIEREQVFAQINGDMERKKKSQESGAGPSRNKKSRVK